MVRNPAESGEKHVYWNKKDRAWRVQFTLPNGRLYQVAGHFKFVKEAVVARNKAYKALEGALKGRRKKTETVTGYSRKRGYRHE